MDDQTAPKKPTTSKLLAPPTTFTTCGGGIRHPENYPKALYRGQWVYFCTEACLRAFEADPDRFIAGEIPHPT